ncbi:MAG TPA: Calx-beta domain-containing protein, partial [Actinomycetota bacterium]|nr:Calx-beta domain-containing protein [Actinomycetota bacterium]
SAVATVTVLPDGSDEPAEEVLVTLGNAVNATIADGLAGGTIVDDDVAPQMRVNDVEVPEGDSGTRSLVFTVSLSGASGFPISVTYTTQDGTAEAGDDYTPVSGSLTFAPGETAKSVTVTVFGDNVHELNENFYLYLGQPSNATLADGVGRGLIVEDQGAPVISVSNAFAYEKDVGGSILTFTITLSHTSDRDVYFHFTTRPGTAVAPADYYTNYGTLIFTPGQTTKTVNVIALPDRIDEFDETFTLDTLGVVNSVFGGPGTGTIIDNDPEPAVAVADVVKTEGTGGTSTMNFPLTLSAPSGKPVTVTYRTNAGSATPGDDYQEETSASVTLAPGQTSINAPVSIVPDSTDEGEETLSLTIVSATNATIADGNAQGTIVDDDAAPTVSVSDVTVGESGGVATFTVSVSAPSAKSITVNFSTANGTATSGSDYVARSGSLTFAPGETSKEVTVTLVGDTVPEPSENFFLNVTGPNNATVADGQGQGTITDDDAAA